MSKEIVILSRLTIGVLWVYLSNAIFLQVCSIRGNNMNDVFLLSKLRVLYEEMPCNKLNIKNSMKRLADEIHFIDSIHTDDLLIFRQKTNLVIYCPNRYNSKNCRVIEI